MNDDLVFHDHDLRSLLSFTTFLLPELSFSHIFDLINLNLSAKPKRLIIFPYCAVNQ